MSCEAFLPDNYQSDTLDVEMSVMDERACELITRPLISHDTTYIDTGDPDSVVIDTVIHDTLSITLSGVSNDYSAIFDTLVSDQSQVNNVIDLLQVINLDSSDLDTLQVTYLVNSLLPTTALNNLIDSLLSANFSDSLLGEIEAREVIDFLLNNIFMGNLVDSHVHETLGDSLLDNLQVGALTEMLITATYDSLASLADAVIADTSISLKHPDLNKPTYLWYDTDGTTSEIVFYTNEYTDVQLIESPGTVVDASAVDMEMGLISGCIVFVTNPNSKLKEPVPAVKSRHVIQPSAESFLIRLSIPEESGRIRVALVEN
ncbi:MAG: hypothetical protein KAU50_08770 [Candidatus Marinimicrobia bacterium]|nr:hypothetical protein [Candidatus Neomarinimicrobiota bacterium]